MRNMYDYAYEYEYQYHPERAGEMFAVVFASLWLAIMIGMLVFMLGSYLLHSFGLYTIAKRMGKKDAWMAFVPFARTYYHGNMAGPIRLKNTTIKNPGLWKLLFPIIYEIHKEKRKYAHPRPCHILIHRTSGERHSDAKYEYQYIDADRFERLGE